MKILIIEDDREIAALVRDYLHIHSYETEWADNGMKGLDMALSGEYDLLILDIMLPGKSGFDVLVQLREKSELPVILLSARSDEIDKVRGLGLGADDYIQKPFSPNELVARVGAHLARYERLMAKNKPVRQREINIRTLKIDLDAHQVFLLGEEILLTNKEFDVLAFLAQNPNRVYSKDQLFEKVWDLDAIGDAGTVVVHIKNIREKLEIDPQDPQFIETVWGAGYRMRV
jgi:DNA-binding response OmpR family regulator